MTEIKLRHFSYGFARHAYRGTIGYVFVFAAIWSAWVIASTIASSALAADVDWKTYGAYTGEEGDENCFYEEKGITRTSDGHVRVWTKCLLQKDLDSLDLESDLGKKIVDAVARKLIEGYLPPIARVSNPRPRQLFLCDSVQ